MPAIISNAQLCTVLGRSIHDGNIFIRDTISYRNKKISAILMSLDQQKAFDMVNRHILLKTMKAMNVYTDIIKFISTIYSKTETCLEVNGRLSETISLESGVRQGCPLSAALYSIYIQTCISFIIRIFPLIEHGMFASRFNFFSNLDVIFTVLIFTWFLYSELEKKYFHLP